MSLADCSYEVRASLSLSVEEGTLDAEADAETWCSASSLEAGVCFLLDDKDLL